MKYELKKIGIIITLVILLPSVFFTIIQLNSANETEKDIESIYKNRLNTVVFSVNQFSEDIVTGWKTNINLALGADDTTRNSKLELLVNDATAVEKIVLTDLTGENFLAFPGRNTSSRFKDSLKELLSTNEKLINRLQNYKRGEYFKNEPLSGALNDAEPIIFLFDSTSTKFEACLILLKPERFILDNLLPKIEEIAGEDLQISVTDKKSGRAVCAINDAVPSEADLNSDLWLLRNFSMNISLKGVSLDDLVRARLYTNLGLLLMLNLFIIGAAIFLFINLKKQVEITRIKSDFVSNVSHELRTPLALISMFAETLEMGRVKTEEKKQEYYTIINKEAGRLSRIVNKILNFSKMEAGKRSFNFTNVDVNAVIEDIIFTYSFHLKNKGFDYHIDTASELPIISADQEAIAEAVINLIDNAIKYSGDTKKLSIKTSLDNHRVSIEIKDEGIGIAEKDQKRIFEKFYRVSTGLVHNTKGTGLGLSLVKHIVEAHNGEITVKSSEGKGTTFTLLFPIINKAGE